MACPEGRRHWSESRSGGWDLDGSRASHCDRLTEGERDAVLGTPERDIAGEAITARLFAARIDTVPGSVVTAQSVRSPPAAGGVRRHIPWLRVPQPASLGAHDTGDEWLRLGSSDGSAESLRRQS